MVESIDPVAILMLEGREREDTARGRVLYFRLA
jgi:hypothetical protein